MDIFQTTLSACAIIYNYLDAVGEYSAQSRSLAARFKWDTRVLERCLEWFTTREVSGSLSMEDAKLLEETVEYLESLLQRLQIVKRKLESQKWWKLEMNRALWILHRTALIELELELFEWTQRFDLRLIALPRPIIATVIDDSAESNTYAPTYATRIRMERYLKKGKEAKSQDAQRLWVNDSSTIVPDDIAPARVTTATFLGKRVIIENKPIATTLSRDPHALQRSKDEVSDFAGALNTLDTHIFGLLKCVAVALETGYPRYILVHELPFPVAEQPRSLMQLINATGTNGKRLPIAHSLNQRFDLARKLAAAVFFLHSVGWVHKDIRPHNVLVLEKANTNGAKLFPRNLGTPFLVNFHLARSSLGWSDPDGRGSRGWELDIYKHPERQGEIGSRFTVLHDIYSLGVTLLELGLWRPLSRYADKLKDKSGEDRRTALIELAEETEICMGRRFRNLVIWALTLEGDDIHEVAHSMRVLEQLEDLVVALG
ncbi:hypothetical protein B0H34DRAFT_713606 [Crassisporium funariophilum]|nr:hypothetical protein B0H34DRAFT_713606 [Crassisporium funariophilum]